MKSKIKITKEAILIAVVLLLALLLFLVNQLHLQSQKVTGEIEIYSNGNFYKSLQIKEGETFEILNGEQKNILQFTKNGVYMLYSNCDNQLCVSQGEVNAQNYKQRALGNKIICLPHGIVIYLKLVDGDTIDLPDV